MLNKIWTRFKDLFLTKQFLRYTISGVIVTLVDNGVFHLLSKTLGLSKWYLSLLPAIILSIIVAYFINRIWVFKSSQPVLNEIFRFCGSRLAVSLIFQYAGFYLFYDVIGFRVELIPAYPWAKVIATLFVIIGNYLVGRFFVFTSCSTNKSSGSADVEFKEK